jgi:hypothetical protein
MTIPDKFVKPNQDFRPVVAISADMTGAKGDRLGAYR